MTEGRAPVATPGRPEGPAPLDSEDAPPSPPAAAPGAASAGSDAMSQRLATRIEQDAESPLPWRSVAKKTVMVVVAGITIYLVFPSLTEVFSSFPKLTSLDPVWFAFAVGPFAYMAFRLRYGPPAAGSGSGPALAAG